MSHDAFPPMPQSHLWPTRSEIMAHLMRFAFQAPITALEIGVWYGVGSTNLWLDTLPPHSRLLLLDSWKPYSSQEDLADKKWNYGAADILSTDAFLSAFLTVRKHETQKPEKDISIHLIRGDSSSFLPLLGDNTLDFIYIDGDHKYDKVKSDLKQAKRLVKKDFGIICGDDLERLPTPELIELAKENKQRDYLRAPHNFHPGVLLGVAEEFENVNMMNGFWWVTSVEGVFSTIQFSPGPAGAR
jgi:hypothetical protein